MYYFVMHLDDYNVKKKKRVLRDKYSFFCHPMWQVELPQPGIQSMSPTGKCGILTTGPPGNPRPVFLSILYIPMTDAINESNASTIICFKIIQWAIIYHGEWKQWYKVTMTLVVVHICYVSAVHVTLGKPPNLSHRVVTRIKCK